MPSSFANIFVNESNKYFKDINGTLFSKDETILYFWPPNRNETFIAVPQGVELIWLAAFSFHNFTKYVIFPSSVRTIQGYFFYTCKSIEYIEIQNKEYKLNIDSNAFFRNTPADSSIIHYIPLPDCKSQSYKTFSFNIITLLCPLIIM